MMKKQIFIILIGLFFANYSIAQDLNWDASGGHNQQRFGPKTRGFYFGPVVGINVSTVNQITYAQARVRPIAGLMIGYQISKIIGIQAEGLYSWQGASISNTGNKLTLNYLKVPILAKLNLIGGLGVEAGVSFEPLIYSKSEGVINKKDDFNKMDFTIPVGASFLIARRVEINARYYIPCVKVFKAEGVNSYNSVFSFTLRYRF